MEINSETLQLIGVHKAADLLGISDNTLRQWLCHRRFPYVKVGRRTLIAQHDLVEFVERNRIAAIDERID